MIELEKTYLAKHLPDGLEKCPHKELVDVYIPLERDHPTLRLRKRGNSFEMTKKSPVKGDDSSEQLEQTIELDAEEYGTLSKISGKVVSKKRYYYPFDGHTAEVDVFQGDLDGLVLVDVEFSSSEEKDDFSMPDFCLADVTQEKFTAGGMLCGKSYADIENDLKRFGYEKITI